MLYENYIFQNNRYHIGGIKNIYLQPFEDNITYRIDDRDLPICTSVQGSLIDITPANATLTQNSSFDRNRFAFSYNLDFSFQEDFGDLHTDFLENLRKNKYRAFVRTNEGDIFLVNAEYPFSVTYEYNWVSHLCTIHIQSMNNIPLMLVESLTEQRDAIMGIPCGYVSTSIISLELIEENNVRLNDENHIITSTTLIGDATWKTIEPIKGSFDFVHSFDGYSFQDTLQFDIELSDYLSTFHYNLLEFAKNHYITRFKTGRNNTIVSSTLFPSFELGTQESLNRIRIILRGKSYIELRKSLVISDNVNDDKRSAGASKIRNKIPASTLEISGLTFPTIECVSPTMAKRILFPQIGINGDETGKYYVLDGYGEYFAPISDLIVGTIYGDTNESMFVYTPQCEEFGCIFSTTLSARNYMINSSTDFFSFISSCGWEIVDKDECLTFSQSSGDTNELSVVDVTSSCDIGEQSHFTIKVGDDEYEYIYIKVDTSSCFIQDSERHITAQAQRLTFQMDATDVEIVGVMLNDNTTTALTISTNGSTLSVSVPEYTDFRGFMNIWRIQVQSPSGGYCEIYIYQDHPWMIYKVEPNMYECYDGDKYHVKQGYSGYTRDTATIPTGIYTFDPDDAPWERDSQDCATETITKWFDSDDYYCEPQPDHPYIKWSASTETMCSGTSKYNVEYQMVSDDGETWSATTNSRIGELIETNSTDCGYCPKQTEMRDSTDTICDGYSLKYVAYQWESRDCGETWQRTSITGYGTTIEEQSSQCGYIPSPTGETQTRWVDSTNTICENRNLYILEEQQISTDNGITWVSTGKIRVGTLLEENSSHCYNESGDTITQYLWREDPYTICDNENLYAVEAEYVSTDGQTWRPTGNIRRGRLIEEHSQSCAEGEVINQWFDSDDFYCEPRPDHPYSKWSASTETMCSGTTKYAVEYQMESDDGVTWSATTNSRIGYIIETQSEDCGYGQIKYKWEEGDGTICSDGDLYSIEEQYISTDGGTTWRKTGAIRIASFIESDSEQCGEEGSGITMYKWVESTESTICIGSDLYSISYRYVSYDEGASWTMTGEYRTGSLIESDSRQCSDSESGETIYKWEDSEETMCDGTSLFYKAYEYQSTDEGVTWTRTGEFRTGTLIALNSPQCTTEPMYKWESNGETMCYNGNLYEIEERWVSYDNGVTWSLVGMSRRGDLIESASTECVDCVFETRWISTTNTADTICQGTTLYLKSYEWWSDDCWETSARTDNMEYRIGDLVEEDSYECGYRDNRWVYFEEACDEDVPSGATTGSTDPNAMYKWDTDETTTCVGYDLHYIEYEMVSYDSGTTWIKDGQERVGELIEENSSDCGYVPPIDYSKLYFTIDVKEEIISGATINFSGFSSANTLSYSTDSGITWSSPSRSISLRVRNGDKILFKGTSSNGALGAIYMTRAIYDVYGNIMSLIYGDNFEGQTILDRDYVFKDLFNTSLNRVSDASNLILPATTLTEGCYEQMFNGCVLLSKAPELPATTLAPYCYYYMFNGCEQLWEAPLLPATTLAESCYGGMFTRCISLQSAPELLATTLADSCYTFMFNGCERMKTPPSVIPATTLAPDCCSGMFSGCTGLQSAPELPATTLVERCYFYMFDKCTSLTTAPSVIPATTMASSCCYAMFKGCTSLTQAPELPATTLAEGCYNSMFNGCTSLATAPALPATTLAEYCYENMFYGCTSLETAPELLTTTLVNDCYYSMFRYCTKLNYIKMVATDIPSHCMDFWVDGVANSGTFVKKSTTTLPSGRSGIPNNWTIINV